jgi:DHA3 family macrolide efflux protein-like MFS transporter
MRAQAIATEPKPVATKRAALFQNRRFLFLWLASIFTGLTMSMFMLAEEWYIVKALGLEASLGLVMMATTLPRVLFMSLGGVLADRLSRSFIMAISDWSRAILIIGMVALLFVDRLSIGLLTVFALCFGILEAFFWPAAQSLLPKLVSKEQLVRANSVMQTTNQFTLLIGPLVAGVTIIAFSYEGIFTFCAILLGLAGLLILLVKDVPSPVTGTQTGTWAQLVEGLRYVRESPFLLALLTTACMINFFGSGPLVIAIPIIVAKILQGNAIDLSLMHGAFAVGMIIGAVWIGWLNPQRRRGWYVMGGLIVLGLWLVALSQVTLLWQGMVILMLHGICSSVINIPVFSLIQEQTDPGKMGRVMSLVMMSAMGLMPLSFGLVATLLSVGVSVSLILLVCGVILVLFTSLILWKAPVLRRAD